MNLPLVIPEFRYAWTAGENSPTRFTYIRVIGYAMRPNKSLPEPYNQANFLWVIQAVPRNINERSFMRQQIADFAQQYTAPFVKGFVVKFRDEWEHYCKTGEWL